jgi:hypothetical protein
MEFYWRKVHSLNLKCLMIAGEEWIEVSELMKELGLKGSSVIAKKTGLRTAYALDGKLLIARQSIKDLAVRLRAGTNNRVLTFKAIADELTYGLPADVLVRKALTVELSRRKRDEEERERNEKVAALTNALNKLDAVFTGHRDAVGLPSERVQLIWSELQSQTQLSDDAIRRFFSGKSIDSASRLAYANAQSAKRNIECSDYFEPNGRGRTPKITQEICRQIKHRSIIYSPEELADQFDVGVTVVKKILSGSYKTKATS